VLEFVALLVALGTSRPGVTLAATRRARLLKRHGTHLHVDGATPVAMLTLFAAGHARLGERQFEVLGRSTVRLFHGDADFVVVVGPSDWTSLSPREPAEHLSEQVRWETATVWEPLLLRPLSASELIEVGALLGIAQDLIGLLDLLELLGVTALVGVVLAGKFAIGFLDVIGRGVSGQTENIVHPF
jgi:hypothetical protein